MKLFIMVAVLIMCSSCGSIYINKEKCTELGGPVLKCDRDAKLN